MTTQPMMTQVNAFFSGSGSAAFSNKHVAAELFKFMQENRQKRPNLGTATQQTPLTVAYIGTATYDAVSARQKQCGELEKLGARILPIDVAWENWENAFSGETSASQKASSSTSSSSCSLRESCMKRIREIVVNSDSILVSGGNSLYSIQTWKKIGLDKILREAALAGCILSGGSFGALCWFSAGHSDSMDPATFRPQTNDPSQNIEAQSQQAQASNSSSSCWKYIRVGALGFLPGLCCPHFERRQSNGVLRADDFNEMLLRHPGETALCIDHWCCFKLQKGGKYSLYATPEKNGSVWIPEEKKQQLKQQEKKFENILPPSVGAVFQPPSKEEADSWNPEKALPGAWRKKVLVVDDEEEEGGGKGGKKNIVVTACLADEGDITEILQDPTSIVADPLEEECGKLNPIF